MSPEERNARAGLHRALLAGGIPAEFVPGVVDLSFEASSAATTELRTRLFEGPHDPRISLTAAGCALSLLLNRVEAMRAALLDHAGELGVPIKHTTISTQALQ